MTKTKVETSSLVNALLSSAAKSETHKMNQIKAKDAHSKPKRDLNSNRKEPKRYEKARRSAPGSAKQSQNKPSGRSTGSDGSSAGDDLSKDSGGKTDSSSSETSDCTSEENRAANNHEQNFKMNKIGEDRGRIRGWGGEAVEIIGCDFSNSTLTPAPGIRAERSISPFAAMDVRWRFSASGALEFSGDEAHDDLLREIDDLRSENEYLKVQITKALYVE